MFIIGMSCSAYQLCFAIVSENIKEENKNTAVGLTNMILMSSSVLLLPILGHILSVTQGTSFDSYESYTVEQYRGALILIPFCLFLSFLFSLFILPEKKSSTGIKDVVD